MPRLSSVCAVSAINDPPSPPPKKNNELRPKTISHRFALPLILFRFKFLAGEREGEPLYKEAPPREKFSREKLRETQARLRLRYIRMNILLISTASSGKSASATTMRYWNHSRYTRSKNPITPGTKDTNAIMTSEAAIA